MGAWLRRHGVRPRRADDPGADAPAGDRDGPVRPGLARPLPRRPVAAHDPQRPARQGRCPGLAGAGRHRARVHRLRHDVRGGGRLGLPRPHAGEPVQRRLLDPRHHPRRAAAAGDPQRHVRRRARRRGRQGRVQLRPARDRVPLRRRPHHLRQPLGLQDRRQGDRRPAGQVADLHGEVQPARGQLLPHPPVAARRRTASLVFWDKDAGTSTPLYDSFVAGVLATAADFTLLYAPNINSYKRFAAGSFAPTAIAWGHDNRTCAVRLVGKGAGRADGEPDPGRRREPLPRHRGDAGRWPARHRAGPRAGARARRQRLRLRQAARPDRRWPTRGSGSRRPRSRAPCFGDEVVDHYVNMADVELAAYGAAVTDWELRRGFERL